MFGYFLVFLDFVGFVWILLVVFNKPALCPPRKKLKTKTKKSKQFQQFQKFQKIPKNPKHQKNPKNLKQKEINLKKKQRVYLEDAQYYIEDVRKNIIDILLTSISTKTFFMHGILVALGLKS